MVLLLNLRQLRTAPAPRPVQEAAPARLSSQNLWLTLAPSVVPLGIFSVALFGRFARVAPAGSPKQSGGSKLFGFSLLGFILFAFVPLSDALAVNWRPTPTQAWMVAFSPWLLPVVLVLSMGRVFRRMGLRQMRRMTPMLDREQTVEVAESGVTISDDRSTRQFAWSYFRRYTETVATFMVLSEDYRQHIWPKRALTDAEATMRLKSLLNTSIEHGTFLPVTSSFAVEPVALEPID